MSPNENFLNDFLHSQKASKFIYKAFISKRIITPTAVRKWSYCSVSIDDWNSIFRAVHCSVRESKIRAFQYKFIHRIVPTNKFLYSIKRVASPNCTFCLADDETLDHFFFSCPVTILFWGDIQRIILKNAILFCKEDIFFSYRFSRNHPLNFLLFHAKYYIYTCRYKAQKPDINAFTFKFKFFLDVEKSICKGSNSAVIAYFSYLL